MSARGREPPLADRPAGSRNAVTSIPGPSPVHRPPPSQPAEGDFGPLVETLKWNYPAESLSIVAYGLNQLYLNANTLIFLIPFECALCA